MIATAATTPITIPAIAPPDKPAEGSLFVVPATAALDGELVGVTEETETEDVEVVDVDVDVDVDADVEDAVEVEAIVEVSPFERIRFSGIMSNAMNVLLAFLRHTVHE